MRLICPNCDARYEVPDEVMPVEGRDVQCSNCGQTWFQHHPDFEPDAELDAIDPDMPSPDEEISPPPPPMPQTSASRKELDPAVADILREEAEAEQSARREQEPQALESQPDLGIDNAEDETERRTREARERMARMRGEEVPDTTTAAALSSRRDLLPDIEEINSTLRSSSERSIGATETEEPYDTPVEKKRRSSWRTGFMFVLLIAILMLLFYMLAPQIAKVLPQIDPLLTAYVSWIDQMRLWLDDTLQSIARWLDVKASQSAE